MRAATIDDAVHESLTRFALDLFEKNWKGREHEAVSLFAFNYLQRRLSDEETGLAIGGCVPGVPERDSKGRVCKDLVIWPSGWETAFDDDWEVTRFPLALLEWTVSQPRKRDADIRAAFDYDVAWIADFSRGHSPLTAYAVLLDLKARRQSLKAARASNGSVERDWLNVRGPS